MELKALNKDILDQLIELGFDCSGNSIAEFEDDFIMFLPEQALVVKWFRDKFDIIINVEKDDENQWFFFIEVWEGRDKNSTTDVGIYATYEDAEERAILKAIETLKAIIDGKQSIEV